MLGLWRLCFRALGLESRVKVLGFRVSGFRLGPEPSGPSSEGFARPIPLTSNRSLDTDTSGALLSEDWAGQIGCETGHPIQNRGSFCISCYKNTGAKCKPLHAADPFGWRFDADERVGVGRMMHFPDSHAGTIVVVMMIMMMVMMTTTTMMMMMLIIYDGNDDDGDEDHDG